MLDTNIKEYNMQNKNLDILHRLENTKKAREKFDEYTKDTYKYVDKYKDYFPEGHKGGWNDSVDAFRHAFMQAHLKYKYNDLVSKNIAKLHQWVKEIYDTEDDRDRAKRRSEESVGKVKDLKESIRKAKSKLTLKESINKFRERTYARIHKRRLKTKDERQG